MKFVDSITKPLKIKQQKAWIVSEILQTAIYLIVASVMFAITLYWIMGLR